MQMIDLETARRGPSGFERFNCGIEKQYRGTVKYDDGDVGMDSIDALNEDDAYEQFCAVVLNEHIIGVNLICDTFCATTGALETSNDVTAKFLAKWVAEEWGSEYAEGLAA